MSVTKEDLHNFQQFADEKLANGAVESLQNILDEWNARREREQSIAGIRESIAQYDAGEGLPVDKAFGEVRKKLGWAE